MSHKYGKCSLCETAVYRLNSKFCGSCWDVNRPKKNREGFWHCSQCGVEFPLTDQHFHKNAHADNGFGSKCKPCVREYNTAYYRKRKAENGGVPPYRHKAREYSLRHAYGLTPEDVPKNCQVCGSTKKICVDHCHETGRLRGFLCDACNKSAGLLQDDANRLRALADYLEK